MTSHNQPILATASTPRKIGAVRPEMMIDNGMTMVIPFEHENSHINT